VDDICLCALTIPLPTSFAGQHQLFSSAPTSTPLPVSVTSVSTSPKAIPPNDSTSQSQQARDSNQLQLQPMAAPATSQPASQTQPALVGGPGSPLTPEQLEKEKERVTLLLEINQALLHELVNMQKQGKGGNVQQPRNPNPSDENEKLAAPEYVEYVTPSFICMDTKAFRLRSVKLIYNKVEYQLLKFITVTCDACKQTLLILPPMPNVIISNRKCYPVLP